MGGASPSAAGRRRSTEKAMPFASYVIAAVLFVTLLPTVLRQPPDQASTAAEFSPDAPPDDVDSIVATLQKATTGTAGTGDGVGPSDQIGGDGMGVGPAPAPPRSCPRGYGNPPRQTFSIYAAPCIPRFVGDNGGATYQGVTANEIRVAVGDPYNDAGDAGPVQDTPPEDESAQHRTWRVLQAWFNANYDFYGRRLRFYVVPSGLGEQDQRSGVVTADDEYQAFAVVGQGGEYGISEAARRKMVAFANLVDVYPSTWLRSHEPYAYIVKMEVDRLLEFTAEFACKQLLKKPAAFAGDPLLQQRTRKLGLVHLESTGGGGAYSHADRILRAALVRECGETLGSSVAMRSETVVAANDTQALATAINRLKADGVTTVIPAIEWVTGIALTRAATNQDYFPEWLVPGLGQLEHNSGARLMAQEQWKNAFGVNASEMVRRVERGEGYRAYKEIDPTRTPTASIVEGIFPALEQLANGIQLAGPSLNPETFRQGLHKVPARRPDPLWSMGGAFRPGDASYSDYAGIMWWDPTARDDRGGLGAYRWVRDGYKYSRGEIEPGEPVVFRGGTPAPPPTDA